MTLNKLNDEQLHLLGNLGITVDRKKDYEIGELEEILDVLSMRISLDEGNISDDGKMCEDIITVITTDKDW